MHLLADHRLTDPNASAVRAALRKACASANGKRKTGTVKIANSDLLTNRVLAEREGHYSNHGTRSATDTARISLAWWTAPGGRKLVRVRSWREPWQEYVANYNDPRRVAHRELTSRPAVWHLDPERMTIIDANGETQCVAVCGCGAAGSPESLAWAGGMCGPCRDRVEEHGPASVTHEPGVLTDAKFDPWGAAFSPDGVHLAAFATLNHRAWNWRTGKLVWSGGRDDYNNRFARPPFGPDNRLVFHDDDANTLVSLAGPPSWKTEREVQFKGALVAACWTGRPGELLVQGYDNRTVQLVTVPDGKRTKPVVPSRSSARLHAVHADADRPRAVLSDAGHVIVCRVSRQGELRTEHTFRLGVGQYDRTGYWGQQEPKLVRFTADGERLLFVAQRAAEVFLSQAVTDEYLELWNPSRPRALLQVVFPARIRDVQFSPDGEHLFVLGEDGSLSVCHPGLVTHVRARFRWHAGSATSLSVSPDGRTVATTGVEGVRLWPVSRLLEVL